MSSSAPPNSTFLPLKNQSLYLPKLPRLTTGPQVPSTHGRAPTEARRTRVQQNDCQRQTRRKQLALLRRGLLHRRSKDGQKPDFGHHQYSVFYGVGVFGHFHMDEEFPRLFGIPPPDLMVLTGSEFYGVFSLQVLLG
jgi:hypothetical protein